MKKLFSLLSLFLSFSLIGCSTYKIEKGMSYMGLVPSLNLGIQTNQTEYEIENVNLDIYYGWHESYFCQTQGYEWEGVVIFASDSVLPINEFFNDEFVDYYDLKDVKKEIYNISTSSSYEASCHILKVINEDLNNEKYIVKLSTFNKALYKTHELFTIPSEVLVNPRVGFSITIVSVAKNIETGKYKYLYSNSLDFNYKILENGKINLV